MRCAVPVRPALTIGALALALGSLSACGASADDSIGADRISTQPATGPVDDSLEDLTVGTGDGQADVAAEVSVPDQFPDDVPLPLGEHTITAATVEGDEVALVLASSRAFDLGAEGAHLTSRMEEAGYTIDQHSQVESGGVAQFYLDASGHGVRVNVAMINADLQGSATYSVRPSS